MFKGFLNRVVGYAIAASFLVSAVSAGPVLVAQAETPATLALELTVEPSGGEVVTVGIIVRNMTSKDVDPVRVAGWIPPGAVVLGSWAGAAKDYPGKFEEQEVSWHNSKVPADGIQGPFSYKVSLPKGSAAVFRAQASWQNPTRGTATSPEILVNIPPVAVPGVPIQAVASMPEHALPGGRFFKQANGQGGAGASGFAVVDGGVDSQGQPIEMYKGYVALGGPARLGYPISRRYKEGTSDDFTYQAFQNGVLQWDPGSRSARLTNIMDALHDAQLDVTLEKLGYAPWEPDSSAGDFAKARAERWSWLDDPNYADFKKAYFNSGVDPETFFGLPTSHPRTYGWIRVVRLQRAVFATYNNGPVMMASVGDDAKKAGYLAGDVLRQQSSEESDLAAWMFRNPSIVVRTTTASIPPPAPVVGAPTVWKFKEYWIKTAPNCSATILRGELKDILGNLSNGELVKTWNDWGNEAFHITGLTTSQGTWERYLGQGVKEGVWHVQVLHPTTRAPISPVSTVRFTDQCNPTGVQEITIYYRANY